MSGKLIALISGIGALILFSIMVISIFSGTYNRVVTLEENINTSKSNISKEEKRRADLFNNLADVVQAYDKHEQTTLQKVIEARQQANGGNIDQAMLTLAAVVEQYPQLKSQEKNTGRDVFSLIS